MSEPEATQDSRRLLVVRLLYAGEPRLDRAGLAGALSRRRDAMQLLGSDGEYEPDGQFSVAHTDLVTEANEKSVPLFTAGFVSQGVKPMDTTQSWGASDDLKRAAAEATHEIVLAELFAFSQDPAARLRAFADVVAAVAEVTDPVGAWALMTERLLTVSQATDPERLAFNIRLFTVAGEDDTVVIDSLGLDVFGLPDVQLHARGIDTQRHVEQVWAIAAHLLEQGDVIETGHTVQGVDDAVWRCQHEDALVGPARIVLDLDPGDPWAAGQRHR